MSQHLYQFCPRCAHALEDRPFEGKVRRTCSACGFIHFPDPKVAVVALIEANERVLLIRRAVNPGRGLWALPGGYMDAGELPDAALRREVREEVGIDITVGELLEIFPMVNGKSYGLVEELIDQQRYINRLIALLDFIMGASAWLICTAPTMTALTGGTCTVMKN